MFDIKTIRKYLHTYPELSRQEKKTSKYIVDTLKSIGYQKIYLQPNEYSIVCELNGKIAGKTILFRCELDALPIQETNTFNFKSKVDGVSHKCGHDGHMSIMIQFAQNLINNPPKQGTILLLFQSAEETGMGAASVIQSGLLNHWNIDYVFALHNMPGYELGSIVCKPGSFTPAVESISIELTGKTSHAGEPDKGINPAKTTAKIIDYLNSLHNPDKLHENYFLSTPIQILLGEEAYGTSAGNATIRYTFRTWSNKKFSGYKTNIEKELQKIVTKEKGLKLKIEWLQAFKANINHPEAYQIIKNVASNNQFNFIEKEEPMEVGEDFGIFTEHYKGAMFLIGAGKNCPALHNPDYDFPEELIELGTNMFIGIIKNMT